MFKVCLDKTDLSMHMEVSKPHKRELSRVGAQEKEQVTLFDLLKKQCCM
jgi:hypothetical protein